MSERTPGGFAATYKVLAAFEETGRCRRGYFVEGLGAAQFGTAGAIDRLRTHIRARRPGDRPEKQTAARARRHRPRQPVRRRPAVAAAGVRATGPGRKAGAIVSWSTAPSRSTSSAAARRCSPSPTTRSCWPRGIEALGRVVREGALGRLTVEKADGASILGQDSEVLRRAMESAGFIATPRGLRLRG